MALPAATAPLVALLLLVAAGGSGAGEPGEDAGWSFSFDTMIGCAPAATDASDPDAAASFRASLAPLLAALPAAAAATGFASLPSATSPASGGAVRGRARALGLCFGPAAPGESGCVECIQAAVAAVGACTGDARSAGAWRPGCAVVYADDDSSSSLADESGNNQSHAGDARPVYPDSLEKRLAELAEAVAQRNRRPLWKMALSVLFYVLAAIGAVTVVFLLCGFLAGFCLAESLFRNVQAAGLQRGDAVAGAEQGEGIAVYVAATNGGPAPVWSVAMQLRFH
ncbi:unnamed protein product [Urochloa decumbens]|uniref:Gnk2-homologous domain-containing protein n=1 Tax=Urochloa decumbens TaxID=240449 RepID=A0ABC8W279_9POAL